MTTNGNDGQTALITGASGGIGLELARVLAVNGFSLVLLARSRDKLEDLARELRAQHGTTVTIIPAERASQHHRWRHTRNPWHASSIVGHRFTRTRSALP